MVVDDATMLLSGSGTAIACVERRLNSDTGFEAYSEKFRE